MDGPAHVERTPAAGRWARWLWAPEDPSGLAVFRILLGVILTWDISRFITSGWVESMFLEPQLLFKYYGFGWVHPLPAPLHHAVFWILLAAGIGIAAGVAFRWCATVFFVGHAYVFLLASSYYLNHAYLICLLTLAIIALPMDRALSVRVWRRPTEAWSAFPRWPRAFIVAQVGVVYVFGAVAKINADWLLYSMPIRRWLHATAEDAPFAADLLTASWFAPFIAWGGFAFDLLIFPALLWRKSRPVAVILSTGFHLSNAFLFRIGVFPWMMLAITTLFLEPTWPRRLPLIGSRIGAWIDRGRSMIEPSAAAVRGLTWACIAWFSIQLWLPLRHHLYPGDVAWTEEGHLYSWRMKLRSKRGRVTMRVVDPVSGESWRVEPSQHLGKRQERKLAGRPELILQYAHFLDALYRRERGVDVEVYADAWISLNYRKRQRLIDPHADLSRESMRLGPYPFIEQLLPTPPPTE